MSKNPLQQEYHVGTPGLEIGQQYYAVDLGSTGTRTVAFSPTSLGNMDVIEVPSEYVEVTDVSHLESKSNNLYDLMEYVIKDTTAGKATKPADGKHVVKCGVASDTGQTPVKTTSNQGKIEQDATYINLLVSVATRLYMAQSIRNTLAPSYKIDLTVSLPTADIMSKIRKERFIENVVGTYEVRMPRAGLTLKFEITNVLLEDESQAALRYWATRSQKEVEDFANILVIDGGGRSFDIGYLENGRLNSSACHTTQFGGNRLETRVRELYTERSGESQPTLQSIRKAIPTGLMQDGAIQVDISEYVKEAKYILALEIMDELNKVFDSTDGLSPKSFQLVLTTGGCFNPTGQEDKVQYTSSLTTELNRVFAKSSPNTKFERIKEKSPIVKGLVFYRISKG